MWSRRELLGAVATLGAARALAPAAPRGAMAPPHDGPILRTIPSSGERVPAIGLGSWQTFDVEDITPVTPVLARFLALGGRVIDSSPMYGRAEAAIGAMLARIAASAGPGAPPPRPFLATKVWTTGAAQGVAEMRRSLRRLGATTLDLMQIHNLVDWRTHLRTLRAWKEAGTIRHIGITHYAHGAFDDIAAILAKEPIDVVQLPYSVLDRAVERRLLPLAQERGVAVLVMEPFGSGALFRRVRGVALPAVAAELGCTSWAQLALKFLLGHPAVTCPLPATSKVAHLEDNLGALHGPVPTAAQRAQILAALA